ncbi:MAG: potassium channel family protein [Brevundimonas sp.]
MSNLLPPIAGAVLLGLLTVDVFVTALTLRGAGPLTGRLAQGLWRGLLRLHRGRAGHRLLGFAGGAIAALTLAYWVLVLWAGWALVFAGAAGAVVDSQGQPADLWSRIYFAGFNIFTLGLGDYRPVGAAWQMATVLASASGLVVVTLGITYLLPVLSHAVSRQALAGQVGLLGPTPARVALNARAQGLDAFAERLSRLEGDVLQQGRRHLAYPVLHYFHTGDPRLALPLRLAVLYEGLLILTHGLGDRDQPPPPACLSMLAALDLFLDSVAGDLLAGEAQTPPAPSLTPLADAGAPVRPRAAFEAALRRRDHRRALMRGLLAHDGWGWSDVGDA